MGHYSNNRAGLADGRAFHKLISRFYDFESKFNPERMLIKANGRRGCSDLFLWVESDCSIAVVIETKWSDWDTLSKRGTLK